MIHDDFSVTVNKDIEKVYNIPCEECLTITVHKVLSSVSLSGNWDGPDISYWEDYQIIQCQGCMLISFRKSHRNTDNINHYYDKTGEYIEELAEEIELYPKRVSGRKKIKSDRLLPFKVGKIYNETFLAYANNLHVLTAIGIRGLLEAVCIDKVANGNNLSDKIDELVKLGVLTQVSAEILHKLRLLGNESAHEIEPPHDSKLSLAMDVVENLLETVYIIPSYSKGLDKSK